MDRTSLDWAQLFKNGLSAVIKHPGVVSSVARVLNAVATSAVHKYRYVFKQMFQLNK